MEKIIPGDVVICDLCLERGEGKVTYICYKKDIALVIWGRFGKMLERELKVCKPSNLKICNSMN